MTTFISELSNARVEPPVGTAPSTKVIVKTAQITFDRTWSPYVQGQLVCQRQSSPDATATDPRRALLTKFTLSQQIDAGTPQTLDVAAWLRSRTNDFMTDEATLSFASVESIMQDHVDASGQQYSTATTDLTVVQDALGRMAIANGGPVTLSSTGAASTFTIPAADAGWDTGTSIWDAVNAAESPKSIWVHGDETGLVVFRQPANYSADTTVHEIYGTDRVISVTDVIDRDSSDWANAVFINYFWNKGANNASDYGLAGTPSVLKSVVIDRHGKRSSTGEAAARAERMVQRGRTLNVTAIADLTARPNQQYFVGFRDVSWFGIVRRVTFRYPEGLMDLVIDITDSQS